MSAVLILRKTEELSATPEDLPGRCIVCARVGFYTIGEILAHLDKCGQVRLYCDHCQPALDLPEVTLAVSNNRVLLAELEMLREKGKEQNMSSAKETIRSAELVVKYLTRPELVPFPRQHSLHYDRVATFMELAGQDTPDRPKMPDEKTRLLRAKLMFEETLETIRKGLGVELMFKRGAEVIGIVTEENVVMGISPEHLPDLAEVADGCADVKVVTTGTLIACGIADERLQWEVDVNNLKKFGPGGHRREDGKWVKPPDHQPPNIAKVISEQS